MADGVLSQPTVGVPSFMANIGYAYAKANNQEINSVINEPYASKLPTLFNGDLDRSKIDLELTTVTTGANGLFVQSFVSNYFAQDDHWMKVALNKNNLHAWAPTTSVRLVHCEGDDVIPYAISQLTEGTMNAMGAADVKIVPVEVALGLNAKLGHGACGSPAYGVATKIFATVRKQTIGY
jgi:hypothetical protein